MRGSLVKLRKTLRNYTRRLHHQANHLIHLTHIIMYNYKKSLNMEPRSSSKRWQTTTASALQETAAAIRSIDRSAICEDMRSRKINNTKSSINFGSNKIDYVSDMMDNQRK
jgi:hypothetical protein